MDGITFKLEGLETTLANLDAMSKATQRNAVRRTLKAAGEPIADVAASVAPVETGRLAFSIAVATKLTRRHAREQRNVKSEVEVYIGPTGGQGALNYASHVEFGTIVSAAEPYMRPAWEATKAGTLARITAGLKVEVGKVADRAAKKAARLARV